MKNIANINSKLKNNYFSICSLILFKSWETLSLLPAFPEKEESDLKASPIKRANKINTDKSAVINNKLDISINLWSKNDI